MKHIVVVCCLLFLSGCAGVDAALFGEPAKPFVFSACATYGDSYLTAMSQYVCMLDRWNLEVQGHPPPPQAPSQMYSGSYPQAQFQGQGVGSSFMQGYSNGYAGGAQAGAIMLQSARNQAYGIALNKYYSVVGDSKAQ